MSNIIRNNQMFDMQDTFDKLYARAKNNDNFYKLVEIIKEPNNIRLAYRNLRSNTGSTTPGVDKQTIREINKLSDEELIRKATSMINNWQPKTVRRVFIPKENGEERPLGIPAIWDRLIQQCILQVLNPIAESKFYNHSYGFRPNRSAHHALSRMVSLINRGKMYYCINVDIKGFFDNVNHNKLIQQMWTMGIRDKRLLTMIRKLLKTEIENEGIPDKGTPQGGIISPILSNIYLNELDWWVSTQWENFPLKSKGNIHSFHNGGAKITNLKSGYIVRYADDFKIMCRSYKDAIRFYHSIIDFLEYRLKLQVSEHKTNIVNLKKKHAEFLGFKVKAVVKESAQHGFVAKTNICDKAIIRIHKSGKRAIKGIQNNSYDERSSRRYNSLITGIKNYYQYATHVYLDLDEIGRALNKSKSIRLRDRGTKISYRETPPEFKILNKGMKKHTKIYKINDVPLNVINAIKHKNPMNFRQGMSLYTKNGRKLMGTKSNQIPRSYLSYLIGTTRNYLSVEFTNHRISSYIAQKGECMILKELIFPHDVDCHHRIPRQFGGTDDYHNLVIIHREMHKLIHAVSLEVIKDIIVKFKLTKKQLKKINEYRNLANLPIIE